MGILKLPKYMELPGGVQPITRCRRGDVAEFVIVTNFKEQVERASQFLDQIASKVEGDEASYLITGMYKGFRLTIANCGIGVGQTSNILEELINLGGRVFIQLGATGALQRDISVGEIIVPTGSVRDEGLSDYYAPKQYPATADYRIVTALVESAQRLGFRTHAGIIRTTEGCYPSQRVEEFVRRYHDLGVLGVEQEVSGILTICSTRGCFAGASLMVIGNLVTGVHFWKGDNFEIREQAWFKQIEVILMAMQSLHERGAFDSDFKRMADRAAGQSGGKE